MGQKANWPLRMALLGACPGKDKAQSLFCSQWLTDSLLHKQGPWLLPTLELSKACSFGIGITSGPEASSLEAQTQVPNTKPTHSFIHSLIRSFNKYLLGAYRVLDLRSIIVNRRTAPASWRLQATL